VIGWPGAKKSNGSLGRAPIGCSGSGGACTVCGVSVAGTGVDVGLGSSAGTVAVAAGVRVGRWMLSTWAGASAG
jgi:hypothetical protein